MGVKACRRRSPSEKTLLFGAREGDGDGGEGGGETGQRILRGISFCGIFQRDLGSGGRGVEGGGARRAPADVEATLLCDGPLGRRRVLQGPLP